MGVFSEERLNWVVRRIGLCLIYWGDKKGVVHYFDMIMNDVVLEGAEIIRRSQCVCY